MSKAQLIDNLYALYSQMTIANGFNFDWQEIKSDNNGAIVWGVVPQFHIKFEDESNADEVNGLGNNEFQNTLPCFFVFGAIMSSPSESLNTVARDKDVLKANMLSDIKRAFGSPYKINMPGFYCGSEYNGEDSSVIDRDDDSRFVDQSAGIDPYTVIGAASVTVTYKESRGIGEW